MDPVYILAHEYEVNKVFKPFLHLFGLNSGLLLSYFLTEMHLQNGNWFSKTQSEIKDATMLSSYQQRSAISKLSKLKILETSFKGYPAKLYYKINSKILFSQLKKYKGRK